VSRSFSRSSSNSSCFRQAKRQATGSEPVSFSIIRTVLHSQFYATARALLFLPYNLLLLTALCGFSVIGFFKNLEKKKNRGDNLNTQPTTYAITTCAQSIGHEKDSRRRSGNDEHSFSFSISSRCVWSCLTFGQARAAGTQEISCQVRIGVSSQSRHAVSAESSPLHEIGNFPHGHVPGQSLHPEVPVLREQNHFSSQTPRLSLLC